MKLYRDFFKRGLDIAVSGSALVVLAVPLGLCTAFLHYANKGAGAFFKQDRPGTGWLPTPLPLLVATPCRA